MGQLQKVKHSVAGIPEGEEREKGTKEIFEAMTKNFPKLVTGTNHRSRKLRTSSRINTKKHTSIYIIFKMKKIKEKTLKEATAKNTLPIEEQG